MVLKISWKFDTVSQPVFSRLISEYFIFCMGIVLRISTKLQEKNPKQNRYRRHKFIEFGL